MPSEPYLKDSNGQKIYEGRRMFTYKDDGITKVFGTLCRGSPEDFYKWFIRWDDQTEVPVTAGTTLWPADGLEWEEPTEDPLPPDDQQ